MNIRTLRFAIPAFALVASVAGNAAQAQFYKTAADRLHVGSISVGATGQFSTMLNQNPTNAATTYTVGTGTFQNPATATNQQQYTTDSVGFLTSFGLQPFKGFGVELNYGFTHYSERFAYNYTNAAITPATQRASAPTDQHEFTGAYIIRPKHIPFQPFIGVGGGAIDFTPSNAGNQWRGAGLLETGFNLRTKNPHLSFRVEGRSLYYRSPNYNQPIVSTRSWRVTEQPSVSAFYNF